MLGRSPHWLRLIEVEGISIRWFVIFLCITGVDQTENIERRCYLDRVLARAGAGLWTRTGRWSHQASDRVGAVTIEHRRLNATLKHQPAVTNRYQRKPGGLASNLQHLKCSGKSLIKTTTRRARATGRRQPRVDWELPCELKPGRQRTITKFGFFSIGPRVHISSHPSLSFGGRIGVLQKDPRIRITE